MCENLKTNRLLFFLPSIYSQCSTDPNISANQFTEKAGKHSKAGGGNDGLGLAGLPSLVAGAMYKAQFKFADDDDIPYSFVDYIAQAEITGEVFRGVTDFKGYTEIMRTSIEQEIKIHLLNVNSGESI